MHSYLCLWILICLTMCIMGRKLYIHSPYAQIGNHKLLCLYVELPISAYRALVFSPRSPSFLFSFVVSLELHVVHVFTNSSHILFHSSPVLLLKKYFLTSFPTVLSFRLHPLVDGSLPISRNCFMLTSSDPVRYSQFITMSPLVLSFDVGKFLTADPLAVDYHI